MLIPKDISLFSKKEKKKKRVSNYDVKKTLKGNNPVHSQKKFNDNILKFFVLKRREISF